MENNRQGKLDYLQFKQGRLRTIEVKLFKITPKLQVVMKKRTNKITKNLYSYTTIYDICRMIYRPKEVYSGCSLVWEIFPKISAVYLE